jgi:amylosucrase
MNQISIRQPQVAIVTTIADVASSIDFFVRYHLSLGFKRLFIFLDAPCDQTQALLADYPQVTLILRDELLSQRWSDVASGEYRRLLPLSSLEVMARQELNMLLALEMARSEGLDWLLHIDSDELFYPHDLTLGAHFLDLERRRIGNVSYLNYEAQVEREGVAHPFEDISLFKRNFFRSNLWVFNATQRELLQQHSWLPPQFFNFYQNGKSAVRLDKTVQTNGVHFFKSAQDVHFCLNRGPVILHFSCASVADVQQKYARLGNFPDTWNGLPRTGKLISDFHIQARDAARLGGDLALARLFRERLLPPPGTDLAPLLDASLFIRLPDIKARAKPREQFVRQTLPANTVIPRVMTALRQHLISTGCSEADASSLLASCRDSLQLMQPLCDRLYPGEQSIHLLTRCYQALLDAKRQRDPALDWLPDANWAASHSRVGGCLYIDRFADNFQGLQRRVEYLSRVGINFLYLMPMFKRPLGANDGGFAISDYRETAPELGSIDEFRALLTHLRQHGIAVAVDFVLNHTADDHPWARRAAAGDAEFQEYYHFFDDEGTVREYLSKVIDTFPDQGHDITYNNDLGRWIWTTFNRFQWDLNYENPAVLAAMLDNLLFLSNLGIDAFRFDAIPHIWKRKGTPCKNQPECHLIVELFSHFLRQLAPHSSVISEAIVAPEQVKQFVHRDRASLAYRPLLSACLWQALSTADTRVMSHQLARWSVLPAECNWLSYVNCHDDLHWTFSDPSLRELFPEQSLADFYQPLLAFYRNKGDVSFARGLPFQQFRISGSTASLAGLEKALEQHDVEGVERSVRRIVLLHAIVLAIGGLPMLYLGDEMATLNDYSYRQDPELATDSRWVHRPYKDWALDEQRLSTVGSPASRVFHILRRLIAIRLQQPIFAGPQLRVLCTEHVPLFVALRETAQQRLLLIGNFTPEVARLSQQQLQLSGIAGQWQDLLLGSPCHLDQDLQLEPYGFRWLLSQSTAKSSLTKRGSDGITNDDV